MCSFWLRDASTAEDAVQDTFIKAYKALPEFRHECSEKTWLLHIAANTCRDMRKSRWFRFIDTGVSIENLPEPAYTMTEEDDTIIRAIQSLPQKYSEVILLHFWQNLTMTEIAKILNTSLSTVSRRMAAAEKKLRMQLKEAEL